MQNIAQDVLTQADISSGEKAPIIEKLPCLIHSASTGSTFRTTLRTASVILA